MWAGYIALVNQQLVANGKSTIGFINPTIYTQNVTSSYGTGFHDITSGTSGNYSAVPGYDLVTGWGSPNGSGLINSLGPTASASSFGPPRGFQPTPISIASEATTGNSTTVSAVGSNGFSGIMNLACSTTAVAANDLPTFILTPASLMLSETTVKNFALTVNTTVATSVETRVR
jgi:hypothetical protein